MPVHYTVVPGAPSSPIVLHVPHAATHTPARDRTHLLLDDTALDLELAHMTDAHTDAIAATAADGMTLRGRRPWMFVNRLSRLVVDPERFPDDREEMASVGMGAVYMVTSHGQHLRSPDAVRDRGLIRRYFDPYSDAIADLVDARLAATGRAVIVDVHSYPTRALPYERHGDGARPPFCLGTDAQHTGPDLLALARASLAVVGAVEVNTPFSGTYVPLRHLGIDLRVSSLMVEIRRDVYMVEPGGPPTAGLPVVAAALHAFLATI